MNPRFDVMREGARANMIEWGKLAETVTSVLVEGTEEPKTPTINVEVPECDHKEDGGDVDDDDVEEQGTQV